MASHNCFTGGCLLTTNRVPSQAKQKSGFVIKRRRDFTDGITLRRSQKFLKLNYEKNLSLSKLIIFYYFSSIRYKTKFVFLQFKTVSGSMPQAMFF